MPYRPSHNTAEEALVYLTDCTLATVEDLMERTRPPKGEITRQILMAQTGMDIIRRLKLNTTGCNRVADILGMTSGDVAGYYQWDMPR